MIIQKIIWIFFVIKQKSASIFWQQSNRPLFRQIEWCIFKFGSIYCSEYIIFLSCLPHLQCQSCLVFCGLVIPVLKKKIPSSFKTTMLRQTNETNNSWIKLHSYFASFIQLKNTTLDLFLKQRGLHSAASPAWVAFCKPHWSNQG